MKYCQTVKDEYELIDISFNTWIKPLEIYAIQDKTLYILVPTEQMGLSYITKKYYLPLKVAVTEITGIDYELKLVLPEQAKSIRPVRPKKTAVTESAEKSNLNPNYTFETFVVGNNNRFAHSVMPCGSGIPGEVYNPCFMTEALDLAKLI